MAYHSDYYDTEEYADKPNATHCEECGELYEHCQCLVQEYTPDEDPGQPEGLFDAYNKSGDEADLPF